MMGGKCKCFCHIVMKIFKVLSMAAAVLFVWASFAGGAVWGWTVGDYFMWSLMLMVLSKGNRGMCKCCHGCGHGGCSCNCDGCKNCKVGGDMGSKTCSHPMDCKCGDCDRCK